MMQRALICGVNGQDGAYLARLLVYQGYDVWGTSRDAQTGGRFNLRQVGVENKVRMLSMAPNDFRSVFSAIERSKPDEIYYLSGQSSVGLSFEQPAETLDSIVSGMLNLLEAVRMSNPNIRVYHAGSSECFGDTGDMAATEKTPFHPRSPYAVAKASAHWLVRNYREAYGLYCCTGILFNHESPLRPTRFVTKLEDFVAAAFAYHDLDWREYVTQSDYFTRPSDIAVSRSNPAQAEKILGWKAENIMPDVVRRMCEAETLPKDLKA